MFRYKKYNIYKILIHSYLEQKERIYVYNYLSSLGLVIVLFFEKY